MSADPLDDILRGGPDPAVPMALRRRHLAVDVGTTGVVSRDVAAAWPADLLDAVLHGGGLTRAGGRWRRERTLADTVGADMRVLLVGLNPSVYSADVGVGFARPGNRFWPAALASGLVTSDRDPAAALVDHGVGMTDLVKRATARADELDPDEYMAGAERLRSVVEWLAPRVVCIVGLSGWRVAVDRKAVAGPQDTVFGGRPVYVMPNPSGLNARATPAVLAEHFRSVQELATRRPRRMNSVHPTGGDDQGEPR